jgi:hypothetical protein
MVLPQDLAEVGAEIGEKRPEDLPEVPPNHACGDGETYRVCDGVIADVVSDKQLMRCTLTSQTQKTFFISGLPQLVDQRRGGDER